MSYFSSFIQTAQASSSQSTPISKQFHQQCKSNDGGRATGGSDLTFHRGRPAWEVASIPTLSGTRRHFRRSKIVTRYPTNRLRYLRDGDPAGLSREGGGDHISQRSDSHCGIPLSEEIRFPKSISEHLSLSDYKILTQFMNFLFDFVSFDICRYSASVYLESIVRCTDYDMM